MKSPDASAYDKLEAVRAWTAPFLGTMAGFSGILLEAKSGSQSFADTVHQLKAYSSALRDSLPGPLLVWGVVEEAGDSGGAGGGNSFSPATRWRWTSGEGTRNRLWV